MAKITRTVQVDGIGDHRVSAYVPKSGKYAGQDRASLTLAVSALAESAELVKLLADQRITISFSPEVARLVARDVPETAPAWAAQGIKPAAKSAKLRSVA